MTNTLEAPTFIKTIEWDMMDKSKFFPLSMLSTFSVRCCLYPLSLIKTRLQVQRHDEIYKGLIDAYAKIYRNEGVSGLYRGFWVSSAQIFSSVFYISTYEGVRHILATRYNVDSRIRALIAGACASVVGQTIVVPFDILSQHLMMLGVVTNAGPKNVMTSNHLGITFKPNRTKFQTTIDIALHLYHKDGLKGFYRGYMASLCSYVPNSGLWWTFYHIYQDKLYLICPVWVSHLFIQCIAGTLGGFTTTLITNPLDIIRARLQVQRLESIQQTFHILWSEEGMKMFSKGLSARLVQSATFSFAIILGYETIKRMSLREEFKDHVRW